MEQDRTTSLFFEIFNRSLSRHGPGDDASTRKALSLVPGLGPQSRILDIGCGTGVSTLALAQYSSARVVAVDSYAPYIDELRRRAEHLGRLDQVDARVGDMRSLDVGTTAFDLIWCEGAIYNIGFEQGLRAWRPLVAPGGHIALTEVCWTRPDPPAACRAFWEAEYPSIRDVSARLRTIATCGYDIIDHFTLPPSSWWDEYYAPLEAGLPAFRAHHRAEPDAQAIADSIQKEIDTWRAYSAFYSYEFFIILG